MAVAAGISRPRLRDAFLAAMRVSASGVTVVATAGPAGRCAQTVSSMCSVSADPPLLLVCLHARSPQNDAIVANGVFCVNLLATRHDHVADTFAGRPWAGKRRWDFTCGDWEAAPSGAPRIVDALASFDCAVDQLTRAGSHVVYIGRVTDVRTQPGAPLVYSKRRYWRPAPFSPSAFEAYPDARPTTPTPRGTYR
jgi:flavin reductase